MTKWMSCSRNSGAREVLCVGLFTALLLGVPARAAAQQSFEQRLQHAKDLFNGANMEDACDAFKAINRENPADKQTQIYLKISCGQVKKLQENEEDLFNQGVTLYSQGQLDDARVKFEQCGSMVGLRNYRYRDKARDYLRKIDDALGRQRTARGPRIAAPKMGTLMVSSSPTGAKISIDGRSNPDWVTPKTFQDYPASTVQVTVSKPGYDDYAQSVTVEGGKTASLNPKLTVVLTGEINILTTPPGLEVFIDGRSYGPSPVRATLPVGQHTYTVVAPGREPYQKFLEIQSGSIVSIRLDFGALAAAPKIPPELAAAAGYIIMADGKNVQVDLSSGQVQEGARLALYKAWDPDAPVGVLEVTQVTDSGSRVRIVSINPGVKAEFGDTVRLEGSRGVVTIRTLPPGASVVADGRPLEGRTPFSFYLSVGRHKLVLSLPGSGILPKELVMDVTPGQNPPVNVILK